MISISLLAISGLEANSNNDKIKDDIFSAISTIDYTSINILLAEGTNIDTVDQQGNTPLMLAAKIGNPRIMDIILSHNPDINKQNKIGSTALLVAAETGQLHLVKKLIGHGADVSVRDNNDNTAISLASRFSHNQIVEFLKDMRTQAYQAK